MSKEQPENLIELSERRMRERDFEIEEQLPRGSFDGSKKVTFGEAVGAAFENGLTNTIGDWFSEHRARRRGEAIKVDEYVKASPNLTYRFDRLPDEYKEQLREAATDEQFDTMLINAERRLHYEQVLENAGGLTSFGAQVAAGFLDPAEWAVGLATGGLGAAALKGRTLGQGTKALITGLEAGTASAAVTLAIAQQDPTIGADDILASFVVGGAIGAPFGYFGSRADDQSIADTMGNYVRAVGGGSGSGNYSGYMAKVRGAESAGNDNIRAKPQGGIQTTAVGRYQFVASTWLQYYKKTFGNTGETDAQILAKRTNGATQDRVMETLTRENAEALRKERLPVNDVSLYLIHFLGRQDAFKVLKASPGTSIAQLVRKSSRAANVDVFKRTDGTAGGLIKWASGKMGTTPPKPTEGRRGGGVKGQPLGPGKAVEVVKELFPGVSVTSNYRSPDHHLSKKNPTSYHTKTHAAVDVLPIKGITFEQFVDRFRKAGYTILEALNETGKGRTAHSTGDHWHIVLGTGGEEAPAAPARGTSDDAAPSTIWADEEARFDREAEEAFENFQEDPFGGPRDMGSIGAAARGVDDGEYFGTQLTLPGAFARMLGSRVPPEIRQTFGSLISSVPRKDDKTRAIAAENTANRLQLQWLSTAYQGYNPAFRSWAEERGIGLLRQELGSNVQQEFMREVTRAMRGATDVSPQAREAGQALARGYGDILEQAKRAGIEGFEDIATNPNYVPRIINDRKLMALRREIGPQGIAQLISRGLTNNGMDAELADRVGRAYAEGAIDRATTSGKVSQRLRGIADDDIERLRYYLPDDDPGLVDDVISHLKNFRERRNPDGGRIARAKFRLDMDENAEEIINGRAYKLADLFEDDAWQLFERYSRTLSGWIGLAERANIRSDAEWDLHMKNLKGKYQGDPKWKEYEERLEDVKDLILGRPIFTENGALRRTAQSAMKVNFVTTMGQAGMASLAEMGNVVAYGGMRNMMMHLPVFRSFWRQAKDGQLDKQLTEEMNAMGFGMRMRLGRGRAGVDEWGDPIENAIADTTDRILDPFQRTVGYVGLLGPMNDFMQLLAAKSFTQKFANAARGKHKWTSGEILRLRDAGFEDGVLERAMEEIRTHGSFDGKRIVGLGMDKWNRDIAADFRDALDRMTYRAVQENDIGSSAWWMHSTMGRLLTQFRSFVGNALVKQTLYAARYRRDPQVWAAFVFTMFFGGLGYTGRTYLNSIGREDQDEYLEKRIGSVRALSTGALNSTGYMSILPGSIDTVLDVTGLEEETGGPLFQQGRTTGLASSFITGNPTYSLATNAGGVVKSIPRLPRDSYDFSQEDMRRIQAITPLGNVTGIRNMFAILSEDLPKQSQEDDYLQ